MKDANGMEAARQIDSIGSAELTETNLESGSVARLRSTVATELTGAIF